MDALFGFDGIGELLGLPFVQNALIACAVLGLVAGALAPLIVARGMAFAVHGTAELAFTGGAAALLAGFAVGLGAIAGAVLAGVVFGLLGLRRQERDSVIGVVLAFGLGLGVLLLALYDGAEVLLKPVFGTLADRVGARPVLLGGLLARPATHAHS